jgi:hypothetical protein
VNFGLTEAIQTNWNFVVIGAGSIERKLGFEFRSTTSMAESN